MITVENKVITVTVSPSVIEVEAEPTEINIEVVKGRDGKGVPAGGSAGQVLKKVSGTDYDTEWSSAGTAAWGAITGSLSEQEDLYEELDARPTAADLGALAMQDTASLTSDVTGVLPLANGGTGSSTAAGARENLGLGDLSVKDTVSLVDDVAGTLGIIYGGTGAVTASGARENLGLGDLSVKDTADLTSDVSGVLPLANGGTGSSTAAGARENLGLGAMAEAADAPADGSEYVRKNNAWAVSSGGGGGGASWGSITGTLSNQTDLSSALAEKANSADLGALAAMDLLDLQTQVQRVLPLANGGLGASCGSIAGVRSLLELRSLALKNTADLTSDVSGVLPLANGGTNASTAPDARDNLGLGDLAVKDAADLTSDVSGVLPLVNGGTGAATAAAARTALEAASKYIQADAAYTVGTDYDTIQDAIDAVGIDQFGVITIPAGTYAGFEVIGRNIQLVVTGDITITSQIFVEYSTVFFDLRGNLSVSYASSAFEFTRFAYSTVFFGSRSGASKTITLTDSGTRSDSIGMHFLTCHADLQYTNVSCVGTDAAAIRCDGSFFANESGTMTASGGVARGLYLISSVGLIASEFSGATSPKSLTGSMYKVGQDTPLWS